MVCDESFLPPDQLNRLGIFSHERMKERERRLHGETEDQDSFHSHPILPAILIEHCLCLGQRELHLENYFVGENDYDDNYAAVAVEIEEA